MNPKTVIIVGGSSGIGLATAQALARRGHNVVNISRSVCPDAQIKSLQADVTDEAAFTDALRTASENGVHALIYSAGFSMAAPVEHAQTKDVRYLFDVNLFGAITAVQTVLPVMREQRFGKIILVGSIGGVLPIAYDAFYSASKAALLAFCRELNLETNPFGVYATCLLPGGTATRFTFKRKVYPAEDAGVYASDLEKSAEALAKIEQGGMEASEVAKTILATLNDDTPPASVASGFKNKAYYLSQKLMPECLTAYMIAGKYNLH